MEDYDANKPLSPIAYVGLEILYALPIVGLVCAILFSFIPKNQNMKNFARAELIMLVLFVVLILILTIVGLAVGYTPDQLREMFQIQ